MATASPSSEGRRLRAGRRLLADECRVYRSVTEGPLPTTTDATRPQLRTVLSPCPGDGATRSASGITPANGSYRRSNSSWASRGRAVSRTTTYRRSAMLPYPCESRQSADVYLSELAHGTVLLDLSSGSYFGLAELGTMIWKDSENMPSSRM
jgi:hypothetical protein